MVYLLLKCFFLLLKQLFDEEFILVTDQWIDESVVHPVVLVLPFFVSEVVRLLVGVYNLGFVDLLVQQFLFKVLPLLGFNNLLVEFLDIGQLRGRYVVVIFQEVPVSLMVGG